MNRVKVALLGLSLYISTLLGGCMATQLPSIGDPPIEPSPVLAETVLPYVGEHSSCSAVAIEPHTLSTARHCLDHIGAGFILVPKRPPFIVTDAWESESDDVALLHVDETLPLISPVAIELPRLGSAAFVAGYGCDSTAETRRLGVRLGQFIGRDSMGAMWFGGLACHGDSGGGTFDESGALIGVTVLVDTDDSPVHAFGVEPLAGILDGIAHEDDGRDWHPADEFLDVH